MWGGKLVINKGRVTANGLSSCQPALSGLHVRNTCPMLRHPLSFPAFVRVVVVAYFLLVSPTSDLVFLSASLQAMATSWLELLGLLVLGGLPASPQLH